MRIKKRLQMNITVSVLLTLVVCLVLFLSLNRLNKANNLAKIAGDIISCALERVTFKNDYIQTGSTRAKEQWLAKHEQIGGLLKSASEYFRDSDDKKTISGLFEDHESIGKIFTAIVANRERGGSKSGSAGLSREVEERLLNQLNMRVYEDVIHSRNLLESSRQTHDSALMLAGGGVISALLLIIAAAIINSCSLSRAITDRVCRLRDGASMIGGGQLDHRIDIRGDDEFTEISESFNAMTEKLSGSYHDLENEVRVRARAEEELRLAYDRLRTFFDHRIGGIGIVIANAQGEILQANDYYLDILGCSREELLSGLVDWRRMTPREWLPADELALDQLRQRGVCDIYEKEYARRDGARVPVLISTVMMPGDSNDILAFVLDITERKRAEQALRNAHDELELRVDERTRELMAATETVKSERQRLYGVLETLPVYVALLTADHHIPFANREFRARFGESEGRRCFEFLFNRTQPCEICETYTVLDTNAPHHWEWTGPDGRNYDIYDYPFVDADGAAIILEMGIDITEQNQAKSALREMNEDLEQRVMKRTAELQAVNETLRASRIAALNLMEDAVIARQEAEVTSDRLRLEIAERKRAEEELRETNEELTRFNSAAVDRELRMIELKQEVNDLCGRKGEEPRYPLEFEEEMEG